MNESNFERRDTHEYLHPPKTLAKIVRIPAVLVVVGASFLAISLQYPPGFQFVEVLDPLSGVNPTYRLVPSPVPKIAEPFLDHHFKTIKTRVTQTDSYNSRHEYSRHDPFNASQSMILLPTEQGDWRVYRTDTMSYNQSGNLVRSFALEEPRWDRTNSMLLWALEDFSIVTLDVQTGVKSVVKDFSNDPVMGPIISANPVYRITTYTEGEASTDRRFWAFVLQGNDQADYEPLCIFTWDRQQDKVLGVRQLASNERAIDWVGMSPLGNYVLIGADPWNAGTIVGLTMANRALTRFHRLAYDTAHADVALDTDGREVIVMQNSRTDYIDLIPIDWSTSPILEPGGSYAGTHIVALVRLFYDSGSPHGLQPGGLHISCNYPGYAVVSTHIEPAFAEQNWLDRTIVLVRLDRIRPRVYYLAKVYNTTQAYWEETHAAITNDGRRVVWASNWGQNVGQEQMFLMQLDMPPNWDGPQTAAGTWTPYP